MLIAYSLGFTINPPPKAIDSTYIYMSQGAAFYASGDFNKAEFNFRQALAGVKKSGQAEKAYRGYAYLNFGAVNFMLWRNELALQYFDSARVFFQEIDGGKHLAYAKVLLNMGGIYFRARDLKRAGDYYRQALIILQGIQKTNDVTASLAMVNNNLGMLYEQYGNFAQALEYYDEAILIHEKTDKQNLTHAMRNKAVCLQQLGRYAEAELIHLRNLQLTGEISGENHYLLGLIYVSYGFLLSQDLNQFEYAIALYRKAIDIFRHNFGDKHPYISNALLNIGRVHIAGDNPAASVEYIQKSLIALVPDFNETDPRVNPALKDVPSLIEFLEILIEKGKAFEMIAGKNNENWPLEISVNTFVLATEVIDKLRKGYLSEESKLFLSENQNAIFHYAIRVSYKLYKKTSDRQYLEKALFFAEKNKAVNLLASIRQLGAREFGRIPAALLNEENDLKRQIALYTEYIYEENRKQKPEIAKVNLWQQKLFSLNNDYSVMVQMLEENYPDYYRLKYVSTVSGINEIRPSLGKNDLLIQYALSDSVVYIFYICRTQFGIIEQKLTSDFRRDVDNIFEIFESRRFATGATDDFMSFTASANRLYKVLIQPIEKLLQNQNLIIVPDGILSYLPFELLISGLPANSKPAYATLPFLLKEHAISYVHSATLLNEYLATPARRGGRLLAFAPKYEPNGQPITDFMYSRSRYRGNLKPLPFSREEVKNILELVGGSLRIDGEATERNFKRYAPGYNILHMAMHTLIDEINPMFSKLVFTQDNDTIEDGLLNTFEIYNLSLSANMAVLSSCKSGWGKFISGEGVLSLARGFLYAGVQSIVMTLWEIEDQSSAEVMTLFYKYLRRGQTKDEALRNAKLEFLENADMLKSHPYFWGGYIVIGDTSPVFYNWRLVIIFSGSLVILAFLVFGLYKRKRRHF